MSVLYVMLYVFLRRVGFEQLTRLLVSVTAVALAAVFATAAAAAGGGGGGTP